MKALSSWLRPFSSRKPARRRSGRPAVELLEDRLTPSGDFAYAVTAGSSNNDRGLAIVSDVDGNSYVTGEFRGTVDFDPGPGVVELTSQGVLSDIFVASYNLAGARRWARRIGDIGDDIGVGIARDPQGNILVGGQFASTVDFDPGPGVFTLSSSSAGIPDGFVLKLTGSGDFLWARSVGSTNPDTVNALATDGAGNVHVSGSFSLTVDFDPGAGVFNLTSAGGSDGFLLKLDSGGNFVWARQVGGSGGDGLDAVALGKAGSVVAVGGFSGVVDFDPGAAVVPRTSAGGLDPFVWMLTGDGSFAAVHQLAGPDADRGFDVAVDGAGNIISTGYFGGTADFDPGSGTFSLTAAGTRDLFLWKLLNVVRTETIIPFMIDSSHTVPFELFSVIAPGTIRVEVTWTGGGFLTAELTGRRRPGLPDPATPYATATGASPLILTYDVTAADLARGVGWRLALRSVTGMLVQGQIRLTTPTDLALDPSFQRQKVALRSGDLWPSATLTDAFLTQLNAAPAAGLHGLIEVVDTPDCDEHALLAQLGIVRQSFLPGNVDYGFIEKGINLADPRIAALVRSLTPLEPEDKIDPHILLRDYNHFVVTPEGGGPINYARNPDGTLELFVLFAPDVSIDQATIILTPFSVGFSPFSDTTWRVTLAPGNLLTLAGRDEVQWIEAGPLPLLVENDTTRTVVNVEPIQRPERNAMGNLVLVGGFPNYMGLTGAGVTVGVEDDGIDANHPDFDDPTGASRVVDRCRISPWSACPPPSCLTWYPSPSAT